MAETSGEWPAPPTDARPWHTRSLRMRGGGRRENVTVREVQLWGRTVLINEADEVWCEDCRRFVSAVALGRPGNSHRAGLRTDWTGVLLPMGDDG